MVDGRASPGDMCENARYGNVVFMPRYSRMILIFSPLCSGLSPEIVHFRINSDGISGSSVPQDWYIKGASWVSLRICGVCRGVNASCHRPGSPPPYDARYILR